MNMYFLLTFFINFPPKKSTSKCAPNRSISISKMQKLPRVGGGGGDSHTLPSGALRPRLRFPSNIVDNLAPPRNKIPAYSLAHTHTHTHTHTNITTSHVHCRRITENTHARAPKPQQFLLALYSLSRAVCLLSFIILFFILLFFYSFILLLLLFFYSFYSFILLFFYSFILLFFYSFFFYSLIFFFFFIILLLLLLLLFFF